MQIFKITHERIDGNMRRGGGFFYGAVWLQLAFVPGEGSVCPEKEDAAGGAA